MEQLFQQNLLQALQKANSVKRGITEEYLSRDHLKYIEIKRISCKFPEEPCCMPLPVLFSCFICFLWKRTSLPADCIAFAGFSVPLHQHLSIQEKTMTVKQRYLYRCRVLLTGI